MNRWALALPLIALAACGNEPEVRMENSSVAEVAQEMRKARRAGLLNPGKWQHKVTLLDFDAPGMPPELQSMTQGTMAQVQTFEHCLTPEKARRPNEDFFTKGDQNCRYEHFNWSGGKIDMKLNCGAGRGKMTMVQTGEYQPDALSMTVTQIVETGSEKKITTKAKLDAKRIGECDPNDGALGGN